MKIVDVPLQRTFNDLVLNLINAFWKKKYALWRIFKVRCHIRTKKYWYFDVIFIIHSRLILFITLFHKMARFICFVQLFVSIDWLSSILASDLWTVDHEFAFVHIYFTKFLKIIIFYSKCHIYRLLYYVPCYLS